MEPPTLSACDHACSIGRGTRGEAPEKLGGTVGDSSWWVEPNRSTHSLVCLNSGI